MRTSRSARRTLHLAILGCGLNSAFALPASAQVSGTWNTSYGQTNPSVSWSTASNWLNGAVPGNGGVATFAPVPLVSNERAGVIQNVPGLTLSGITFTSNSLYFFNTSSNAITLTGAATIDAQVSTFRKMDAVSLGHIIQVPFAGSNGLTKTGPGTVALTATNTYTGGTFINGGMIIARRGDATFGAAGEPISISNATLRIADQFVNATRPIHLAGVGTIDTAIDANFNSTIDGQSLTKTGPGTLILTANNTYTGATSVLGGTLNVFGTLANTSALVVRSDVHLNVVGTATDRVNDAALVRMQGGTLALHGGTTTDYIERVGDTILDRGNSSIAVDSQANRTTTLALGNVSREEHGTAFFFGSNLGIVPTQTRQTQVTFATAPALVGGGGAAGSTNISIIPWAYAGSRNDASFVSPFTHATYGATGVRPLALSEYTTSITSGVVSTENVYLQGSHTLTAPSTVNALRLGGSLPQLNGAGTLSITSGSILNYLDTSTINVPLHFGAAEAVVINSGGSLTFNGPISGSGGFTTQGQGVFAFANNASTYTGTTTLGSSRLVLYSASVPSGAPSAFGSDTSAIVLAPSAGASALQLLYNGSAAAQFDRPIRVTGRTGDSNSLGIPAIGQFPGAGTLTMNGAIALDNSALALIGIGSVDLNVNGNITGHGTLVDRMSSGTLTISGNNTFTGTVELASSGAWKVASNSPFGSAAIITTLTSNSFMPTLMAVGAPRTIPNDVSCFGTSNFWIIGGNQDLTFTGAMNLSSSFAHRIDSTATTTYAGVMSNGGFEKQGLGTLVISGNSNTYTGTGTVSVGVLRAAASNALGSTAAATYIRDTGVLEVAALTNEPVVFGSASFGTPKIRSVSGTTSLGALPFPLGIPNGNDGIIEVLAGTLRVGAIGPDFLPLSTGSNSGSITKVGDGKLSAIRSRYVTLTINGGSMEILPNGTAAATSANNSLQINNGATFDLNDNDFVSIGGNPATIRTYLKNGYNFGGFDGGNGIISSAARNNPLGNTTLGYLTKAEYLNNNGASTFSGFDIAEASILIKYTYFGDVDFNGSIDASDYNLIDFGFVNHLTGWANGDADYSGAVDVSDYNLIDYAFTTQNGVVLRAISYLDGSNRDRSTMNDPALQQVVQHFDQFGDAYAGGFLAAVPEPATGLLFLVAAPLALRRRRRRTLA